MHVAGVRCDPCGAMRWTVSRDFKFSVLNFKKFLNNSVNLARYILPDDDLLRSKHVGVPLNMFMYFNEINMLD